MGYALKPTREPRDVNLVSFAGLAVVKGFDRVNRGGQHGGVQPFKAIAAMSLNRVIGAGKRIPWHLPEDFRWFKRLTTGNVIVMGRRTFESIGRALPNRITVVLSRSGKAFPGARTVADLDHINSADPTFADKQIFICGGGEVYRQALPCCSDLYLTLVKRTVEGDVLFPPFEAEFELVEKIQDSPEFEILHYRRRGDAA